MRLSRSDLLVVGGISSVIITFSLLFYFDVTRKVDLSGSEVVGTLTFKRKIAQRKYSSQVVWEDVQQKTPVYNYDSIRTAELSEAVIKLKDGTEISLDENSMIFISLTDNEVGIDFTQGSIKASREDVSDKSLKTLQIKSQGTTVSIDKSDVSLTQESGKELSLTVNKGNAVIDAGGEKQTLKQDQKIIASKDEVKVFELSIKLLKPEPRAYFTSPSANSKENIPFGWEKVEGPFDLNLEISSDALFEKGSIKRRVVGESQAIPLSEGNYYWRLTGINRNTKKMELSEIRRFSIVRDDAIRIISPENKSVVYYRTELPMIQLKWTETDMVSGYRVSIARDRDMKDVLSSTEVSSPSLSVFDLAKGNYFWKVNKVSGISGLELKGSSPVYQLIIDKRNQVEPPRLISPSENKKISQIVAQKRNIVFSWKKSDEIVKSRIDIGSDQDFARTIHTSETDNNFVAPEIDLPVGKYFWRVTGILGDGASTAASEIRGLEIINSEEVVLVKPEENEIMAIEDDSSGQDINFSWKKIDIDGSFMLEIARNASFSDIYRKIETSDFYSAEDEIKPGRYFWRITMKDTDGNELMKSPSRQFTVLKQLDRPIGVAPADGSVIDMIDKNSITFSWKQSAGATSYRMSLYQERAGMAQWITNIDTTENRCEMGDLKKLDVGSFYWTVQAYDLEKGTNRVLRKSPVTRNNFRIKLGSGGSGLKIKIPDVIYIE
ncbi:MAG TPA: FecR family protein [Spirochaetota bacterium]|nr:FecR family protein [Spirochaetota bacterium]